MAFATTHNGGRTQVNFNVLGTGDYPFINIAKTSDNFKYAGGGAHQGEYADPSTLDSDGYPTTLPAGGVQTPCIGPSDPTLIASGWTMAWDGNGTVIAPGTVLTGSTTSSGGSGSITFTNGASQSSPGMTWGIASTAASPNHIRNVRICLTSELSNLNAGAVFTTQFKQALTDAPMGVLRFLNFQNANQTNLTTWATRKPTTYFTYSAFEFRASLYCGVTSGSINAYTISGNGVGVPASGAPTDKMTMILRFHVNGSGASTLALNGTTAKSIRNPYGHPTAFAPTGLSGTVYIYATVIFDAVLDCWLLYNEGSTGLADCVPPELCIQLCAEVGAHPWYTQPVMASGPPTDFMTQLATHIRDTYNGTGGPCQWMIPRFEGPNELFNDSYHFYQTSLAKYKGNTLWPGGTSLGSAYHDYAGMISSQIGQDIAAVYGITQPNVKTQTKYQMILGMQTFGGLGGSDEKFNSTQYINNGPTVGSYTRSAAKDWATHGCIANYYAPAEYDSSFAEIDRSVDYYRRSDPATVDAFLASMYNAGDFTLPSCLTLFASWKTYFKTFGIMKMCAYEGCYSPDYKNPTVNVSSITKASQAVVSTTAAVSTVAGATSLEGMYAYIYDANGMPQIDRTPIQIARVNGSSFTLNIDSTGFGTYTSGAQMIFYADSGATITLKSLLDAMKDAGKYRPVLEAINMAIYQGFVGLTDSTFTSEFPSHYLFTGYVSSTQRSAWDLQNDIFESPKSAQYKSIQRFNAAKRASPPRMRLHN